MARTIAVRVQAGLGEEPVMQSPVAAIDAGPALDEADEQPAFEDVESSARLITAPEPISPKRNPIRAPAELVAMPGRPVAEGPGSAPAEPARFTSRNWRAEAWDRERERELRAVERRTDSSPRRRSGS
ncbi:MAG: hypothetical protein ABR987_22375 [Terracidiphilus sp.]